jgi:hypothetical protein
VCVGLRSASESINGFVEIRGMEKVSLLRDWIQDHVTSHSLYASTVGTLVLTFTDEIMGFTSQRSHPVRGIKIDLAVL